MHIGAENIEARSFRCAADLAANSLVAAQSGYVLICLTNHFYLTPNLLFTLTGLAFLAANNLINVLDALALVRLRRSLLADFRCELADLLLVDTIDDDLVRSRNFDLDLVRFRNDDLMRETEVHNQVCALLLNTVANTVDFELFLKAFRYTHDHVVDKGTGCLLYTSPSPRDTR